MSDQVPKRKRRASRTSQLRDAMMAAVTPKDIYDIVKLQVFLALKGDPIATREVLDRTIGRPASTTELTLMESPQGYSNAEGVLEAEIQAMLGTVPSAPAQLPSDTATA